MNNFIKKIVLFSSVLGLLVHNNNSFAQNDVATDILGLAAVAAAESLFGYTILYTVENYLIKEDALVSAKYPYAQQWYQALAAQYPDAQLLDKRFLQEMYVVPAKLIQWCSTLNAIYFPQKSLKEIDRIYKKFLDGDSLLDDEKLLLAREEFILLHEAGHIQYKHIPSRITRALVTQILVGCSVTILAKKYDWDLQFYQKLGVSSMIGSRLLLYFSRADEVQADDFACERVGIDELNGAISFFEDEEIDPLINIESKTVTPFVPTNSKIGSCIQWLLYKKEVSDLVKLQAIKKSALTRWIYDFMRGPTHPAPSSRANKLRSWIKQKQSQEKATATEQVAAIA